MSLGASDFIILLNRQTASDLVPQKPSDTSYNRTKFELDIGNTVYRIFDRSRYLGVPILISPLYTGYRRKARKLPTSGPNIEFGPRQFFCFLRCERMITFTSIPTEFSGF